MVVDMYGQSRRPWWCSKPLLLLAFPVLMGTATSGLAMVVHHHLGWPEWLYCGICVAAGAVPGGAVVLLVSVAPPPPPPRGYTTDVKVGVLLLFLLGGGSLIVDHVIISQRGKAVVSAVMAATVFAVALVRLGVQLCRSWARGLLGPRQWLPASIFLVYGVAAASQVGIWMAAPFVWTGLVLLSGFVAAWSLGVVAVWRVTGETDCKPLGRS